MVGTGYGCLTPTCGPCALPAFEVRALVGQNPTRTAERASRFEIPEAMTSLEAAVGLGGGGWGDPLILRWGVSGQERLAFTERNTQSDREPIMSTCETQPQPKESTPPLESRLGPGEVAAWLDGCQTEVVHPGQVEDRLQRAGWSPMAASSAGLSYRRRFNEHPLGYTALLVATGLAALAVGSAGHVLVAGLTRPVNRNALAAWMTLLVCALPFAAWAHWWAAAVDRDDPVAVWSAPRRALARVLLWSSGIVGIGRLMIYVGQLMTILVGARRGPGTSVLPATLNVVIVVSIAVPLWLWAFRFLHRFDGEDPTTPVSPRRAAS